MAGTISFHRNIFKKWHYFQQQKGVRPLTTIHHSITTNSPPKTTIKHLLFRRPPLKMAHKSQKNAPAPPRKKNSGKEV
jgi:hypothetical protein